MPPAPATAQAARSTGHSQESSSLAHGLAQALLLVVPPVAGPLDGSRPSCSVGNSAARPNLGIGLNLRQRSRRRCKEACVCNLKENKNLGETRSSGRASRVVPRAGTSRRTVAGVGHKHLIRKPLRHALGRSLSVAEGRRRKNAEKPETEKRVEGNMRCCKMLQHVNSYTELFSGTARMINARRACGRR